MLDTVEKILAVKKILAEENPTQIPWSTTLQTADGERICVVDVGHASEDYPIFCLIDYGNEIGCDWYTDQGEYDVGVPSGNTLVPIKN